MTLDELNMCPPPQAERDLLGCCASRRWAAALVAKRPFQSFDALLRGARETWDGLGREDWLEAFAAHPRIGDRGGVEPGGSRDNAWSREEQSGMDSAASATRDRLARLNADYERRFRHVYLVCATGKSADELLAILEGRLSNTPEHELRVAAGEHARITEIRLAKLLGVPSPGGPS